MTKTTLFAMLLLLCAACGNSKKQQQHATDGAARLVGPAFSADSAYAYCAAQCAFGPRTMNSAAHDSCGRWIERTFRRFGMDVQTQRVTLRGYDGTPLRATNIIASYRPEAAERILLCAHWDSRPWADNDPDSANWRKPVMAANDGASGVAVLLELARIIGAQDSLALGVDFVCFDAEDWGDSGMGNEESWGLGTQYWAASPHRPGYRPMYGILLDMVGASGATFAREYFSTYYAQGFVDEVWRVAHEAGYGDYFVDRQGGAITDDHVFVNRAGIPCIDIIDQSGDGGTGFFKQWHTTADTVGIIDPATLKAVGQTVLNVIYSY